MSKYRILVGVVIALGVLALSLKLWSQKRERDWQLVLAESKIQDELRIAEFGRKIDKLQAQGTIDNAVAFKSELGVYYNSGRWNGLDSKVMLLAQERDKLSPAAGLAVYDELCRVFENNAEMTEWISEDFNSFAYGDREKFLKAVAGIPPDSFECLPKYFDLSWARATGDNFQLENEKFLNYINGSSLKNNPNIAKIVSQLEHLRK